MRWLFTPKPRRVSAGLGLGFVGMSGEAEQEVCKFDSLFFRESIDIFLLFLFICESVNLFVYLFGGFHFCFCVAVA